MDTALPRSFTEVAGWREAFREAARRLDEVRTGSLFPEIPATLCGEPVRAFTLRDWTILDQAENPLVAGGRVSVESCCVLLRLLRAKPGKPASAGKIGMFRRALFVARVIRRNRYDESAVVTKCIRFIDDAFLDHPCRFAAKTEPSGCSPTTWPRKAQEIDLCAEVMRMYPSFSYDELRSMPLAQFWQWYHAARAAEIDNMRVHAPGLSGYRNYQLTDKVNADACARLNQMRSAAKN